MKRQIVVTIDCEDERCGECKGTDSEHDWCDLRGEDGWEEDGPYMRGPACRAAEKKLRDLVEAGEEFSAGVDETWDSVKHSSAKWSRALAALEER